MFFEGGAAGFYGGELCPSAAYFNSGEVVREGDFVFELEARVVFVGEIVEGVAFLPLGGEGEFHLVVVLVLSFADGE